MEGCCRRTWRSVFRRTAPSTRSTSKRGPAAVWKGGGSRGPAPVWKGGGSRGPAAVWKGGESVIFAPLIADIRSFVIDNIDIPGIGLKSSVVRLPKGGVIYVAGCV